MSGPVQTEQNHDRKVVREEKVERGRERASRPREEPRTKRDTKKGHEQNSWIIQESEAGGRKAQPLGWKGFGYNNGRLSWGQEPWPNGRGRE